MSGRLEVLYGGYTLLAAALAGWLAVVLCRAWLAHRRRARERLLVRYSVRQLLLALLTDREEQLVLPVWQAVGRHRLAAELIAELTAVTYGLDPAPIRRIVVRHGIDRWLLERIRHTRGRRRAAWLRLLADLPYRTEVGQAVAAYRSDRSREVRFATLLVELTATPEQALRLVAAFTEPFTSIEVAELLHLLRRGLFPIAYRPLLASSCANLRRVGLAVVAEFGIEEAEREVVGLLRDGSDLPLARQALYVLAALHRPLRRREVGAFVRQMTVGERRSLLRRLAREEYAAAQIRPLVPRSEVAYYEALVGSYKRSLVCM